MTKPVHQLKQSHWSQAELALKAAVYEGAHAKAGAATGPAQAVFEICELPFPESKVCTIENKDD